MKKNMLKKDLDYYMNLPWTYTLSTELDRKGKKFFVVHVNELPGVATDAPTIAEAMELIKEPMSLIIEWYLEDGVEIPEPTVLS